VELEAFAMYACMVALPGECFRVKADMVLYAGNTVLSIYERIRGVREDVLYLYLNLSLYTLHASSSAVWC